VVTDQLEAFLPFRNGILAVLNSTCYQTKSDANKAFLNEVQLTHLLILFVNDLVVIMWIKNPRHESVGNVT